MLMEFHPSSPHPSDAEEISRVSHSKGRRKKKTMQYFKKTQEKAFLKLHNIITQQHGKVTYLFNELPKEITKILVLYCSNREVLKNKYFFPVVIAIIIIRITQKANTFSCSYCYNYHKNRTIKMERTAKWLPHANKEKKTKNPHNPKNSRDQKLLGWISHVHQEQLKTGFLPEYCLTHCCNNKAMVY